MRLSQLYWCQQVGSDPIVESCGEAEGAPLATTELGENLAHVVLASSEIQGKLLSNIIRTMKEKGYRGMNIDFENVLPADRELYNQFLERAVERLHAEGYFVSSAVAPKVSAAQQGLLYTAHDYEAH